jgi:integrase
MGEKMEKKQRRTRGGIGITKRGDSFEATYSIPAKQRPPGAGRKRLTAWGPTETAATQALLIKLTAEDLTPALPGIITAAENKRTREILGPDGDDIKGEQPAKYDDDLGMLLSEWAAEWRSDWIRDQEESTLKIYDGHIKTYILPYIGNYHLNELTPLVLKRYWWKPVSELRKTKDGVATDIPLLGAAALGNVYTTLRMLLTTAHHKHGTRISLTEKLMAKPVHRRPESDREVKAAAAHLRNIFLDNPNKDDPRWSLFALSLLGVRLSERLGISVSDIDLADPDDPIIHISKQLEFNKAKGGWHLKNATKNGEPRAVPLPPLFLEAVQRQLAWRKEWASRPDWNPDPRFEDLLFLQPGGKLWTRRQDSPAWHEFVGDGIRGHLARHATGHILADLGVSIDTAGVLLGHKSDAWKHYYRVASTRRARQELTRAEMRREGLADVVSIKKRARG